MYFVRVEQNQKCLFMMDVCDVKVTFCPQAVFLLLLFHESSQSVCSVLFECAFLFTSFKKGHTHSRLYIIY